MQNAILSPHIYSQGCLQDATFKQQLDDFLELNERLLEDMDEEEMKRPLDGMFQMRFISCELSPALRHFCMRFLVLVQLPPATHFLQALKQHSHGCFFVVPCPGHQTCACRCLSCEADRMPICMWLSSYLLTPMRAQLQATCTRPS